MKVVVLAPYERKIMKSVIAASKIEMGEVVIIGSKTKIQDVCNIYKIDITSFKLYDIEGENSIIEKAKEIIEEDSLVIIGSINYYYQKKLLNISEDDDFGYINILDLPDINHFIFVCSYPQKRYIDFEEKKKAIIEASKLMKYLGIKKVNASLVTNLNTKADFLEANIIKMIIKDSNNKSINIMNPCKIYDLFKNDDVFSIYKSDINLLILRNYETSKMFIDTMNIFANCKIGSLMTYKKNFLIDVKEIKNEQNLLFSMLVASKVTKNKKSNCDKKQYVI